MLEYLIVLYEYYKTCRKIFLLTNIAFSLLVSTVIYSVSDHVGFDKTADKITGNITTILGILIGFSISMFTLLNTASNTNIEEIKHEVTDYKLYKKPVYLFELLLISLIYIIIFESILLILNLIYPFLFSFVNSNGKIVFCIDIFLLIHVLLVNVSTTVDFYFIITKKRKT